jgi:serine/threonine-protein kinase
MQGRILLDRYEILHQLGEGGMGKVYLARQLDLPRQVVIKVMHEDIAADPKFRERFQQEMLLMARFTHPYAVTLYDATDRTAFGPCIIMEYVRGETLDSLLQRNHYLNPARAGRILNQLCEVLQAAHNQGIVHRDLKPSNLMLIDADTPYEKIKVLDFGLAKLFDRPTLKNVVNTDRDTCIGTPGYMCPEQVKNEAVDFRGDIYSLGVMLYEMLTGVLPFRGMPTMDVMLAHATEEPPPLTQDDRWIPPAIESVVFACLAKQPEDRPRGAMEVFKMYERALLAPEADEPAAEAEVEEEATVADSGTVMPISGNTNDLVFHMQAWLPEAIATYKMRGFITDAGGDVVENAPGRLMVRLGAPGSPYGPPRGRLSWLGIGGSGKTIEMELCLAPASNGKGSNLNVTVLLRHLGRASDRTWKHRCELIVRDLRGYLIGSACQPVQT